MSADILAVQDLQVSYGGIRAVRGISFQVHEGELVTLIGANGAGKTTTMKAITGLKEASGGDILYRGRSIKGLPTHELQKHGIALVPEGRGIFARMTIIENILMGAYSRSDRRLIADDTERMFGLFPKLEQRKFQLAGTLSGGEQQMLAIARALMGRPNLLLLDEPSMGLAPIMVDKVFEVLRMVMSEGVTILLVEQNARLALQAAKRAYVMENGEIAMTGDAASLLHDPMVQAAYLGHVDA